MSLLEPGQAPTIEEEPQVPSPAPPKPAAPESFRPTCANCFRPVVVWPEEVIDGLALVTHVNGYFDQPEGVAFCIAELYDPPPVKWGFQAKGSSFLVSKGPSRVSSGGLAA